jgi:hypothetical protein
MNTPATAMPALAAHRRRTFADRASRSLAERGGACDALVMPRADEYLGEYLPRAQ